VLRFLISISFCDDSSTADAHKMTKYANEDIKFNLEIPKKSDEKEALEINDTL
jgi:hypothetical protein